MNIVHIFRRIIFITTVDLSLLHSALTTCSLFLLHNMTTVSVPYTKEKYEYVASLRQWSSEQQVVAIMQKFRFCTPFRIRCNLKARRIAKDVYGPGPEETEAVCVRIRKVHCELDFHILFADPVSCMKRHYKNARKAPVEKEKRNVRLFTMEPYVTSCLWLNDANGCRGSNKPLGAPFPQVLQYYCEEVKGWINFCDIYDGRVEGHFTEKSLMFAAGVFDKYLPTKVGDKYTEQRLRDVPWVTGRAHLYSEGEMFLKRKKLGLKTEYTDEIVFDKMENIVYGKRTLPTPTYHLPAVVLDYKQNTPLGCSYLSRFFRFYCK